MTPTGKETVLYSFKGGTDGEHPNYAGLVMDASGNLYGTTYYGGAYGDGTVFKVTPTGRETVLYSFGSSAGDGTNPEAGLIMDASGNLYGTTISGGPRGIYGSGTVFKVTPTGIETVLYSFHSGSAGAYPSAGLIMDASGNLYGTTTTGGPYDAGTVFKVTPTGSETVLHVFGIGHDGWDPHAGLIMDASGNLYGTTTHGGIGPNGYGTVFKVTPTGSETVVYAFTYGADGLSPRGGLIADSSGNLSGTTSAGVGTDDGGTVFKLSGTGFVPPMHFEGVPGKPNCIGVSISTLVRTHGGLAAAAKALGFSSVSALRRAVAAYCSRR